MCKQRAPTIVRALCVIELTMILFSNMIEYRELLAEDRQVVMAPAVALQNRMELDRIINFQYYIIPHTGSNYTNLFAL